jgi:hypothetical protein
LKRVPLVRPPDSEHDKPVSRSHARSSSSAAPLYQSHQFRQEKVPSRLRQVEGRLDKGTAMPYPGLSNRREVKI